jgi:hypothetical protein
MSIKLRSISGARMRCLVENSCLHVGQRITFPTQFPHNAWHVRQVGLSNLAPVSQQIEQMPECIDVV